MESYVKGKIPQIIFGSKSAQKVSGLLKKYEIIANEYDCVLGAGGGIDALAHTIEILVGTANNEYTNQILFLCLNKIWKWLPVAVKEPENLEAREQMSWAAHNALANGGVPNGHAVAHAIGSLYHMEMPVRWCFLQWFVILHFMLRKIFKK